jgi:hypothetical protein
MGIYTCAYTLSIAALLPPRIRTTNELPPGQADSTRISHLTDVSRIAGALHSGYTNSTHTKTKEGISMQTPSSRCSGLLLLLMLALLLTACTSSAAPERLTTAPDSTPPEDVVRAFYQGWISAAGNPINQRIYDNTDYLTPDFIQRIDDSIVAQGGIVADPLLCAQNRPSQIEVGEATITGDTASVTVQTIWARGPDTNATRELQVELVYNEGQWRINNVRCAANE